ncbi:MAG: TfoX/Sxy family DNA transformation protein [Hyphomicrobiales bacterium]
MTRPVRELRNLGIETERMLAEVDIPDEEHLRAVGAVAAYHRLKFRFGRRVTLVALYALEGALTGEDWRHLGAETKDRLRRAARRD